MQKPCCTPALMIFPGFIYRAGGLHPWLSIYLHWQRFLCPEYETQTKCQVAWSFLIKKLKYVIVNVKLYTKHLLSAVINISRSGYLIWRMKTCLRDSFLPDGDLGSFSESHSAFKTRVYLSHFHGSFQANHLQPAVTEVWKTPAGKTNSSVWSERLKVWTPVWCGI